jgi:peroxiredoxin
MIDVFTQYPVLSDTAHVAHKAYQVGKGMLGLTDARTTFVIDRKGIVKCVIIFGFLGGSDPCVA